ncbi:MAG: class I SAM-dependent methyltransferase [Chloroflexota bacterium]
MLEQHRPPHYVEVGSGYSTLWARAAIRLLGLPTEITSIDPEPRSEVDAVCDHVIRVRFESTPIERFKALRAGDILFIDGSHRALPNSHVVTFFMDVLPELQPGVIVHIHDIFLPSDYPPEWERLYYSEQYLLAVYLLAAEDRVSVLFPSAFATRSPLTSGAVTALFEALRTPAEALLRLGGSFWFTTRGS